MNSSNNEFINEMKITYTYVLKIYKKLQDQNKIVIYEPYDLKLISSSVSFSNYQMFLFKIYPENINVTSYEKVDY